MSFHEHDTLEWLQLTASSFYTSEADVRALEKVLSGPTENVLLEPEEKAQAG